MKAHFKTKSFKERAKDKMVEAMWVRRIGGKTNEQILLRLRPPKHTGAQP